MDFEKYKKSTEEIKEWLKKEFTSIRTGAASVAILDNIKVIAYGSQMPINQLASIGIEDAKTLSVNPFDAGVSKDIEKAVNDANLGLAVSVSGTTIRLSFPDLTVDRRKMLLKLASEKKEESRVRLRRARDEIKNEIEGSDMTEDEQYSSKEKMEEITKVVSAELEDMYKRKEGEINE